MTSTTTFRFPSPTNMVAPSPPNMWRCSWQPTLTHSANLSDGLAHTGEIHAAPRFDYRAPDSIQDLKELLPTWHQFAEVDTALSCIKDRSLMAEVHRYHHLMGRLGQLDDQMATIEKEMATLIPQKHHCVDRLTRAQAVRHVRKEIGQRIRRALSWEEELLLQSNLRVRN